MLRAIIFDFDGVILDTETPILHAWQEVYAAHGQELPVVEWLKVVGTWEPHFDPYADLESRVGGPLDWDDIEASRRARERELVAAERVLPGVIDHIEAAHATGMRTAIASSSSLKWVDGLLGELGMRGLFECVVTRDDVGRTKPEPDLFVEAVRCLGVAPDEAYAIEDSLHGVTAGKAAGLKVVAVPTELTSTLDFSAADLVIDTLAGVTPDEVWARLRT